MRSLSYAPWYALFAPAGTPPEIIGKLNSATVAALTNSSVKAHFAEIGHEIFPEAETHATLTDANIIQGITLDETPDTTILFSSERLAKSGRSGAIDIIEYATAAPPPQ